MPRYDLLLCITHHESRDYFTDFLFDGIHDNVMVSYGHHYMQNFKTSFLKYIYNVGASLRNHGLHLSCLLVEISNVQ